MVLPASSAPAIMASVLPETLHSMELELAQLRNALVTAQQFATAFPSKTALQMPPAVEAWLEYRIQYLIALQTSLIGSATPPAAITLPANWPPPNVVVPTI